VNGWIPPTQQGQTKNNTNGSNQESWRTPQARDHHDPESKESYERRTKRYGVAPQISLNTQVSWRTPTTMDTKEDAMKHSVKIMQGKTIRASGEPIQICLADQIMIDQIEKNPKLMDQYKDYQMMMRKELPPQKEFVEYLKGQTTIKELMEKTNIKKTTIEHWFRRDKAGFSHPSIEDWEIIKPHLKEVKYNKEMTSLTSIEWKKKNWATPRAGAVDSTRPNKKGGIPLAQQVNHLPKKGYLNPDWVESLMGLPTGWTALDF
jgi:hypothetical protein